MTILIRSSPLDAYTLVCISLHGIWQSLAPEAGKLCKACSTSFSTGALASNFCALELLLQDLCCLPLCAVLIHSIPKVMGDYDVPIWHIWHSHVRGAWSQIWKDLQDL